MLFRSNDLIYNTGYALSKSSVKLDFNIFLLYNIGRMLNALFNLNKAKYKYIVFIIGLIILSFLYTSTVSGMEAEAGPEPTPTVAYPRTPIMAAEKAPELDSDVIFQLVNDYRTAHNLPELIKDENLCKIAKSRGPEVFNEITYTGALHKGLYDRNLPFWISENMVTSTSEVKGLNWWLHSPVHYRTIISHATHSCAQCFGHTCIQEFTSWIPKYTAMK